MRHDNMFNIVKRSISFLMIFVMLFTSNGICTFALEDGSEVTSEDEITFYDESDTDTDTDGQGHTDTFIDTDDMKIESTDSIGAMLLGDIDEQMDQLEDNGCAVFAAEVSGNKVTLDMQTTHYGTLVVAIYDNAGEKMITSGKVDVEPKDHVIEVLFNGQLPEYFFLRAYIVDYDLRPLSEVYNCSLYTEEMQIFLSKTIHDFDEKDVLNLDEDDSNNFLVYNSDIKRVSENKAGLTLTSVDDDNITYSFNDPGNVLGDINPGDVLSYESANGNIFIISVKTVTKNGNNVILTDDESDIEDAFQYIKIYADKYVGKDDIDNSNLEDGLTLAEPSGMAGEEVSETAGNEIDITDHELNFLPEYDIDKDFIEGKLTFACGVTIRLCKDKGIDCFEFAFSITTNIEITVSKKYTGTILELPAVPDFSPVYGVFISFTPALVGEISTELTGNINATVTIGVKHDLDGWAKRNECVLNKGTNIGLENEISLFIGISMEPKVTILSDKVAEASMTWELGPKITGSISSGLVAGSDKDTLHQCDVCIGGDISVHGGCSFGITLLSGIFSDEDELNYSIEYSVDVKLGSWYYSVDHHELGILETCPYELYKTTVLVKDSEGNRIDDATVRVLDGTIYVINGKIREKKEYVTTDENGQCIIYLVGGKCDIEASIEGYDTQKKSCEIIKPFKAVNTDKSTNNTCIIKLVKKEIPDDPDNPDNPDNPNDPDNPDNPDNPDDPSILTKIHNPSINSDGSVTYSTVYFGEYWQNDTNEDGYTSWIDDNKEPIKWRVLSVDETNDDLFLLADENLIYKDYNYNECVDVSWETSTIRSWLNGYDPDDIPYEAYTNKNDHDYFYSFINAAFTEEEIAEIKDTYVINSSSLYDTGGNNTIDKVFLLSYDEVFNTEYGFSNEKNHNNELAFDVARRAHDTDFAIKTGEYRRKTSSNYPGNGSWWLRTSGKTADRALIVGPGGYVYWGPEENKVFDKDVVFAVRPAIHIPLSSELYSVGKAISITNNGEESGNSVIEDECYTTEDVQMTDADSLLTPDSIRNTAQGELTLDFTGLENGKIYNLYAMKDASEDDSLSDNNLTYISQSRSGEDGNLTTKIYPSVITDDMDIFVVGMKEKKEDNTDPIDPSDPTEPSKPEEPEEPAEPSKPIDSSDYTDNTDNAIALTAIAMDKQTLELYEGEKTKLNISFTPDNATNKEVVWSSSDTEIAKVENGEITAVWEGKASVKAVSADGKHEAVCEVIVKEPVMGPVQADLRKYTASENVIAAKSLNLKKTIFKDEKDIKKIKKFKTASGSIDAVKIKGSTLTILKDGNVTIEALSKTGEKLAERTISVVAPEIDKSRSTEIYRRGTIDLNKYINSTRQPAKWKSSSKKIADVSQNGILNLNKSGTVKLTATFAAEKGMKAKTLTIKLKIKMPQFKKATYKVKTGKTVKTAVKNVSASDIVYRIENASIATVDTQGKVTGVSKGTTRLIMTVKGIDYYTIIKVK